MVFLCYLFIWILGSFGFISIFILGEFLTIKFPESKFGKFWRDKIIVEDNDHP